MILLKMDLTISMKKYIFYSAAIILSAAKLCGSELFFDGGFDGGENFYSHQKVFVSGRYFKTFLTGRGTSLRLAKEKRPASAVVDFSRPGRNIPWIKVRPAKQNMAYFNITFIPEKNCDYELTFDYMPGMINTGAHFAVNTGDLKKHILERIIAVNTDWNTRTVTFRSTDKPVEIGFFIKRFDGRGELLLDNISIRKAGNILPRWISGNIKTDDAVCSGFPYRLKASNGKMQISFDNSTVYFNSISKSGASGELSVLTRRIVPEKKYTLEFDVSSLPGGNLTAKIEFLDTSLREVAPPFILDKKMPSTWIEMKIKEEITIPPEAVLLRLTINAAAKKSGLTSLSVPRLCPDDTDILK